MALRGDLRVAASFGLAADFSFDFAGIFDLVELFVLATRFDRRAIDTLRATTWTSLGDLRRRGSLRNGCAARQSRLRCAVLAPEAHIFQACAEPEKEF